MKSHRMPPGGFSVVLLAAFVFALALGGCGKDEQGLLKSAQGYIEKNEPNSAAIELNNLLQQNPNSGRARFLLGSLMLAAGDPVGAALQLQKASDLKYSDPQLSALLARSLVLSGDFKKVVDGFAGTRLPTPAADADLRTSVATAHASLGDLSAANAALTEALRQVPDYIPARMVQARVAAASGDIDGGLHVLDAVIANAPNNAQAYMLQGDLLLRRDSSASDAAIAAYQRALSIDPKLVGAEASLSITWLARNDLERAGAQIESMKKHYPSDSRTLYLEAQLAYQNKNYALSAEISKNLLKFAPTHPRYLLLAGASELQLRSLQQAETHLQQALQAAPDLPMARQLLSQLYLRSGQPDRALSFLEPLLATRAPAVATLTAAGEASLQLGRYDEAESFFSRAAQQNPRDTPIKTALAMTRLSKGEVESAFSELETIAASDPLPSADLALVSARIQRKEYAKALEAIESLSRKQPGKPQAPQLRGQVQLALGQVDAARASFEQSLKIDPVYFPAVASLVALDVAADRSAAAIERVEVFLKADPKNLQALLTVADLRARAGAKPEEVQQLLEKAVTLNPNDAAPRLRLIDQQLNNRQFKLAASTAQAAIAALPDEVTLLDALGRAQLASGETNQALNTFGKLSSLQPNSPLGNLRMADIQIASQNYDGAAQNLKRALVITPNLLRAQQALIAIEMYAKRYQAAIDIARTVQRQRPGDATGLMLEGDIESSRKNWAAAAEAFRAGLGKRDGNKNAVKLYALLRGTGKQPQSDRLAQDWMRDHPRDWFFLSHLGEQALTDRDLPGAERLYRQVIALDPNNAAAHNNLAWSLVKQGKGGAVPEAEKANSLSPNQPAIMETLAMALAVDNQLGKAIDIQKRATVLAPHLHVMRLDLAKLYIKNGDKAAAKQELESLVKLGDVVTQHAEVAELFKSL